MGRKGRCGAVGGKEGAAGGQRACSCSPPDVVSRCDHTPVMGRKRACRVCRRLGESRQAPRRGAEEAKAGVRGGGWGRAWLGLAFQPGPQASGVAGCSPRRTRARPRWREQRWAAGVACAGKPEFFVLTSPQAGVQPPAPYSEVCYSNPTGSVPSPQSNFPKFSGFSQLQVSCVSWGCGAVLQRGASPACGGHGWAAPAGKSPFSAAEGHKLLTFRAQRIS